MRFLNIAQGSVNELETHLILSNRIQESEFRMNSVRVADE
ncbi:MAG: hypothetical protein HEQ13_05605 [Dolichospermum sp. DEX189]|uniref:Four helix bundle protein n=1 Tax=Aphanizomenon flos-aquae FACHB-1040 TaxID=2692887 RepID=A0ABR8BZF3_APHFL|nr:four helix bundle protein [Aphanizomenon flos-aquae FACHB-1040]MBO1068871.1 hypothetical protein [Dolichospermum sp. DEX189]